MEKFKFVESEHKIALHHLDRVRDRYIRAGYRNLPPLEDTEELVIALAQIEKFDTFTSIASNNSPVVNLLGVKHETRYEHLVKKAQQEFNRDYDNAIRELNKLRVSEVVEGMSDDLQSQEVDNINQTPIELDKPAPIIKKGIVYEPYSEDEIFTPIDLDDDEELDAGLDSLEEEPYEDSESAWGIDEGADEEPEPDYYDGFESEEEPEPDYYDGFESEEEPEPDYYDDFEAEEEPEPDYYDEDEFDSEGSEALAEPEPDYYDDDEEPEPDYYDAEEEPEPDYFDGFDDNEEPEPEYYDEDEFDSEEEEPEPEFYEFDDDVQESEEYVEKAPTSSKVISKSSDSPIQVSSNPTPTGIRNPQSSRKTARPASRSAVDDTYIRAVDRGVEFLEKHFKVFRGKK